MGMMSSTEYCNLKVREGKGIEFEMWLKDHDGWKDVTKIDTDGSIEFEVCWKIISYWYEDFLDELEQLNDIIVGEWNLRFETDNEVAKIVFPEKEEDGICITLGNMAYTDHKLDEFRRLNDDMESVMKDIFKKPRRKRNDKK